VLLLEISSYVAAVYLEAKVVIDVACVSKVVDRDGDLCCVQMFGCQDWLGTWALVEGGCEFVGVDVEFGVGWEFFVGGVIVLVPFDPLYLQRTSQFFVEIADDGEIVDVVGLLCGSMIF
jgi:hypothetical protein